MSDLAALALQRITDKADHATCERLVLMWNDVPKKTAADVWSALSMLVGQSLAAAPEMVREPTWDAFVALVQAHLDMQLLTESADGPAN